MTTEPRTRETRLLAAPLVSVVLGLLSAVLLITVVPAVIVGLSGLRRLNALDGSDPRVRLGRRLAITGMVLGVAGFALGVFGLVSLVLLQVNEKSRRANCADNLRRIGKAVALYHDNQNGLYPGATVESSRALAGFAPALETPYADRLGWMVRILPYLERPTAGGKEGPFERLARKFDESAPWESAANQEGRDTPVRGFLCPGHPEFDADHRPAYSYYVGVTGRGADAVELPTGHPDAGFFGYERRLRSGEGLPNPFPKGLSYTLLATETAEDNGPWAAGDQSTLRGVDPSRRPPVGVGRPLGGMHPGGANLLMVDGAVQWYNERSRPSVLEEMARLSEE